MRGQCLRITEVDMSRHRYLNHCGYIPPRIRKLARARLDDYQQQIIKPRVTRNKHHLVINVTPYYRLLSRSHGRWWFLMSHSRYNTEVDL